MRPSSLLTASVASALLLLTAACGATDPAAAPAASSPATAGASVAPPGEVTALKTATTPLGDVVTDGNGRTLYLFSTDGKDATQSACTGACLTAWPPALVGSAAPSVTGITGSVGSIAAPGGGRQLTLGGWPLYYFAQDAACRRHEGPGGRQRVVDARQLRQRGHGLVVGGRLLSRPHVCRPLPRDGARPNVGPCPPTLMPNPAQHPVTGGLFLSPVPPGRGLAR